MADAKPPLDGLLVVDFATTRAELAGRMLAELGAEVFKVEPPGGAQARTMPPFDESRAEDDPDRSLYWASVGASKKSIVADLEDPAARASLRGLLSRADIVIESFDPGEMARLGLAYPDIAATNPGVIYASVTPYGQDGPDAHTAATDLTLEAAGGLLGLQGDPDRPPVPVGFPQASFHGGMQAAADALVALNERERSGLGQHLDVSMQAAIVWTLMNATGYPKNTGNDPPTSGPNRILPVPSVVPGVTFPRAWECADGYFTVQLAGGRVGKTPLQTALEWAKADGLVPAHIAARDWSAWVMDLVSGRLPLADVQEALAIVGQCFKQHTQHELMQLGCNGGLLLAPILRMDGLLSDPQLKERDHWRTVLGRVHPGIPVRLSATPMLEPQRPPRLGEHQAELARFDVRVPAIHGSGSRQRAFEGLKVADFAWIGVGPMVSKALADHGATVVHVESASRPDLLRTVPPFKDNIADLNHSQFMADYNTSKLGLNVDLNTPGGREIARKLIDWSDLVTESFTPGAFERLGFGYPELSKDRPELLMFSTCLRGQTGPQRSFGGYGGQGSALAGIYSLTGWPDRVPHGPWGAYTDFVAPRYGLAAVASAIRHRNRTGQGQFIDLSQVEAAMHFIEPVILDYTVNGRVAPPAGHESLYASPHGVYHTRGLEEYAVLACETKEQWRALCSVAPLQEFSAPEFDALGTRLAHDAAIDAALEAWCAGFETAELVALLKRAGVPAASALRPSELYEDAQLAHRDFFKWLNHTVMGPTPYDGPVTLYSATPPQYTAAPCLGEHTEYVLKDLLGMSEDEIIRYAEQGALV